MIFKGKYVIFEQQDGLEYPVLIPNLFVKHKEIAGGNFTDKPVAAGFFTIEPIVTGYMGETSLQICAWGESLSMNLKSRLQVDSDLIRAQFDKKNNIT
jgi:hypothetical protein